MAEFYTGFIADHYDLLVPEDETRMHGLFRSFIEQDGQPALELACGTGRPLLGFVADGLDVEGTGLVARHARALPDRSRWDGSHR